MTPNAARALAERIINHWRTGSLTEWTETLLPLDEGTAGTTHAKLVATTNTYPGIPTYLAKYRNLHTPANDPIPTAGYHCDRCDNNGLIAAWLTQHPTTGKPFQHPYRYAYNCPSCRRAPWLPDLPTNLPPGATAPDPLETPA